MSTAVQKSHSKKRLHKVHDLDCVPVLCNISQICRDIGRKSPILIYPPALSDPAEGDPGRDKTFGDRKLESLSYSAGLFAWFTRFSRTPTCDRQTDRQTDTGPQYIPH